MNTDNENTTTDERPEPSGPRPGDVIRAKWTMDGAEDLSQAAARLHGLASYLDDLHQRGWTLRDRVEDDYGFLVDPEGDTGENDERL